MLDWVAARPAPRAHVALVEIVHDNRCRLLLTCLNPTRGPGFWEKFAQPISGPNQPFGCAFGQKHRFVRPFERMVGQHDKEAAWVPIGDSKPSHMNAIIRRRHMSNVRFRSHVIRFKPRLRFLSTAQPNSPGTMLGCTTPSKTRRPFSGRAWRSSSAQLQAGFGLGLTYLTPLGAKDAFSDERTPQSVTLPILPAVPPTICSDWRSSPDQSISRNADRNVSERRAI